MLQIVKVYEQLSLKSSLTADVYLKDNLPLRLNILAGREQIFFQTLTNKVEINELTVTQLALIKC